MTRAGAWMVALWTVGVVVGGCAGRPPEPGGVRGRTPEPDSVTKPTIRIGILFDHTGPFAKAGSLDCWRGATMAIDAVNARGGVLGKYRVVQVDGDARSRTKVALAEAERLLTEERVHLLAGVYSSAHAVPLAETIDRQQQFLWITTAIADVVFTDRDLRYVFRPQPTSSMFGEISVQYIAAYSAERFGKDPRDLRVAIIHEDGPYGTGVANANESEAAKQGMQVVLKEGYSWRPSDLGSLVTKLRASRPDVLFHTGYNPDVTLFLRQAKEHGLRVQAYVGHGAGHSQLDTLKATFGTEVEFFHDVNPIAAQLLDPKSLAPGVGEMTAEMVRRYRAEFEPRTPTQAIRPEVSMGFNHLWVLLTDVLPRAIEKHGGWSPEALAAAARETDIPEGGTMQGYGVQFYPPGHAMAGQNARAFLAVFQVQEGQFKLVYPTSIQTTTPVLPLPASSPFGAR